MSRTFFASVEKASAWVDARYGDSGGTTVSQSDNLSKSSVCVSGKVSLRKRAAIAKQNKYEHFSRRTNMVFHPLRRSFVRLRSYLHSKRTDEYGASRRLVCIPTCFQVRQVGSVWTGDVLGFSCRFVVLVLQGCAHVKSQCYCADVDKGIFFIVGS